MGVHGSLVLDVFIIACSSVGKASLVIFSGVLLTRRGALTQEVRKGMSKCSAGLLVPCLLAERLATTVTPALLAEAWPILPVGIVYVAIGCSLGAAVSRGCLHSGTDRRPIVAASAFANSQAMPIILIEVIAPDLFGDEGAAAIGVAYIGLYLCVYLLLQWTIGAHLLNVPLLTVGGGEKGTMTPASTLISIGATTSDVQLSAEESGVQLSTSPLDDKRGQPDSSTQWQQRQHEAGGGGGGTCRKSARAVLARVTDCHRQCRNRPSELSRGYRHGSRGGSGPAVATAVLEGEGGGQYPLRKLNGLSPSLARLRGSVSAIRLASGGRQLQTGTSNTGATKCSNNKGAK